MSEFKVGDRVRVRTLAGTVPYAGKTGEVIGVNSTLGGVAYGCRVRFDGSLPGDPSKIGIAFLQSELESEAGGTS